MNLRMSWFVPILP